MTKGLGWLRVLALGGALFLATAPVWAQSYDSPETDYRKLIRVNQDIQPLGEHPFGENISLYSGKLSFQVTDISASGNGPLMQLTRAFTLEGPGPGTGSAEPLIGGWTIEVPRIQTLITADARTYNATEGGTRTFSGWVVQDGMIQSGADPERRCKYFSGPPIDIFSGFPGSQYQALWSPDSWWQGYQMIIPGQGSQDMLLNPDTSARADYPAVTKAHWRLSCIDETTTANGEAGDGFIAQSPDGTKYTFNELIYEGAPSIAPPAGGVAFAVPAPTGNVSSPSSFGGGSIGPTPDSPPPSSAGLNRQIAFLLVTRIEDRFGNYLTYTYNDDGNLTSITASDGRSLTLNLASSGTHEVQSITLQSGPGPSRTWKYDYDSGTTGLLKTVTLPDQSTWQYGFSAFTTLQYLVGVPGSCNTLSVPNDLTSRTVSVTQPSGLTGTFTVEPRKHGRSFTPHACGGVINNQTPNDEGTYALTPDAWFDYTITKQTVAGAGMPSQTWSYTYSPANDSWSDCSGSCPTSIWTTVVRPDSTALKYTFSNEYDYTDSQLQKTELFLTATSNTPLRTVGNSYANPATTANLPVSAGDPLFTRLNRDQITKYSPLEQRDITQDGDTYTWQAEAYNEYAQTTKTKRCMSTAGQCDTEGQIPIEEQTSYYNDPNLWVLGLPLQSDNLTTGVTVDRYVYNTTNDTLLGRYYFCTNLISDPDAKDDDFSTCNKVMDYTFNSAGQLASFTDGNGNTTTLGTYKRGIPQTIGYPDGKTQSLNVDDLGQIAAITDQAGNTTQYSYDPIGRVQQITYPTDSVAWYPETFSYTYVTAAERGIPGGHWDRTVSQGDARHVTYFDALLRPILADSFSAADNGSHSNTHTTYDWKGESKLQTYAVSGTPSVPSDATCLNDPTTPLCQGTRTSYDALGRTVQVDQDSEQGILTTNTAYLSGARQQTTDPKGNVTTTSYQVFDEPSHDAVIKVQAPEGVTQTITRDIYGSPTAITQDGLTKTLIYDDYHRLCRTSEPESGSTVVAYDAANNIAWSAAGQSIASGCGTDDVAAADRVTRSYDAMNRLLTVNYPLSADAVTTYTYDSRVKGDGGN